MIIFILLLTAILRFSQLGATPSGLYVDEASLGYNAYSLLETGRDEYGKAFPALFKSFGDYKTPVYTYLLIPVYKLWGMNVFTTRSVSAAAGVVTVLFLYLLIKLITDKHRLALLAGLVLGLNPWHILLSRAAIEANLALMFMVIGLWAFYKFTKGSGRFLLVAGVAVALSFTAYHSEKLILPLFFFGLTWHFRQVVFSKANLKWLAAALITALIILTPSLLLLRTPAFFSRASSVNMLGLETKNLWGYVVNRDTLNTRPFLVVRQAAALYTTYFSPKFLFGPDSPSLRYVYPDLGPFLIWQLPFLLVGLVVFLRSKPDSLRRLLILLLLISPLPAAAADEPFGMIRALPLVLPLSVLIALGIDVFLKRWRLLGPVVLSVLVLLSLGRLYLSVFKLNDFYRYQYWDYGTDKIVEKINQLPDQKIQIDGWRSEIYSQLLFFTKADPAKYQADNPGGDLADYYYGGAIGQVRQIGKYIVKPINWNTDVSDDRLLVGGYNVFSDAIIDRYCLTEVFTESAPDGKKIFTAARTNPAAIAKYNQLTNDIKDKPKSCWDLVNQTK